MSAASPESGADRLLDRVRATSIRWAVDELLSRGYAMTHEDSPHGVIYRGPGGVLRVRYRDDHVVAAIWLGDPSP